MSGRTTPMATKISNFKVGDIVSILHPIIGKQYPYGVVKNFRTLSPVSSVTTSPNILVTLSSRSLGAVGNYYFYAYQLKPVSSDLSTLLKFKLGGDLLP